MQRKSLRTLFLLTTLLVLSVHRIQLSMGESATMYLLLATWGCVLLLGAAGILLSVREDRSDLVVFAALVVIALFFVGSYLSNAHLKRESIEAINAAFALAEDSSLCNGSDVWLTLSVLIADNKDVEKFEGFLDEFRLSSHLQDMDEMEDAVYGTVCAVGNVSALKRMEEKASELGWSYHITNLTALWQKTHGKEVAANENTLRIDFFMVTPRWHTELYFGHLSRELAGLGIIASILGLLLRLPQGE